MSNFKRKGRGDYRIFVGAFPGGELAERIQSIRTRYDPKTARITAPHVTLAGTYWRSGLASPDNEAQTILDLQVAAAKIWPFELILGGVHAFPPAARPVVYLGVALTEEFMRARQTLLDVLGRDTLHRFTPHLTLAMRLSGQAAQTMLVELQASEWETRQWKAPLEALHLMQRGPGDPAWRSIARLPFGRV